MATRTRMIEVDAATADALQSRAAAQGLSVSELVAGLTTLSGTSISLSPGDMTDLDREWAAIQAGETTIAHDDVVDWLRTWGTPSFRPWRDQ